MADLWKIFEWNLVQTEFREFLFRMRKKKLFSNTFKELYLVITTLQKKLQTFTMKMKMMHLGYKVMVLPKILLFKHILKHSKIKKSNLPYLVLLGGAGRSAKIGGPVIASICICFFEIPLFCLILISFHDQISL